ncbi:MAG: hypothetical protein Q9187_000434 [Circinaria calcarea]
MSDVRNYLLTIDTDKQGAVQIAHAAATSTNMSLPPSVKQNADGWIELEAKQTTLIDVVQSLAEYINDEDATIRSKAVKFLSQVIAELSPTFLSRQQVQVLCQFLCDRIEDAGAVGGLIQLQTLGRFNKDMAIMTFRALLEHFQDLQIRPQSQRYPVLELLNELMSSHRPALKSLGDESLVGITDLVSGEKDPRNLMIVFSILRVVMIEWDVASHAETLFDSVFCYFPITFRPPPDDPYGITAKDLKARLRECISASRYFAPYAFPQLIDKLDSTSPVVKKDVLQTISACASSYDVKTVSSYSITLWDSLKYEITNVQEEDLAEEALEVLRAIAIRLSHGVNSAESQTPLAHYLRPITTECNKHLQAPQHKQAKPAGQILKTLGSASPWAFFLVVKAVLPPILTLYQDVGGIAKQSALLEVVMQILESGFKIYGASPTSAFPRPENPLVSFKDHLFDTISQALMSTAREETSFRVIATKCLVLLCSLRGILQENEIGMVVQYFDEIVLLEDHRDRDELRHAAIQALVEISRIKPALVMDITLPAFMARLPDLDFPEDRGYRITLEGLALLSVERATSDTLIRRLLSKLDVVLQKGGTAAYPQAILLTLHYVLSQRDLASDMNLDNYFQKIVVALSSRIALAASGNTSLTALNEEASLEILGRTSTLIVRALSPHKQQSVAMQTYTLFAEGKMDPVPFNKDPSITLARRRTMILSTHLLAGLDGKVHVPYAGADSRGLHSLLDELVHLATVEDQPAIRQTILRQIALLINKFMLSENLEYVTSILWARSTGLFEKASLSDGDVKVAFWIAKALILRLVMVEKVLERLLDMLTHKSHGAAAARGFGLLLLPDEVISKENGAIIRLLAKQKVFSLCAPAIERAFRAADLSTKSNYLVALSGILRHTPTEVLLPEIETLLPLLLQSLDLEDQVVKAATIETLTVVGHESPRAVEGHVGSLVSRLLKSAADPRANIPKVRLNALRCLRVFPGKVKESTLLPFKQAVTRGMMTILDDPKRDVRKGAVECRAAWLNLDEPSEDN